jgi:hypothetical protein
MLKVGQCGLRMRDIFTNDMSIVQGELRQGGEGDMGASKAGLAGRIKCPLLNSISTSFLLFSVTTTNRFIPS